MTLAARSRLLKPNEPRPLCNLSDREVRKAKLS
jgi:hypothetical protein